MYDLQYSAKDRNRTEYQKINRRIKADIKKAKKVYLNEKCKKWRIYIKNMTRSISFVILKNLHLKNDISHNPS